MNFLELRKKLDENGIYNAANREKLLLAAISFPQAALLGLLRQKGVLNDCDIRLLDESFDNFFDNLIQSLLQEYQDARMRIREEIDSSYISDAELDRMVRGCL